MSRPPSLQMGQASERKVSWFSPTARVCTYCLLQLLPFRMVRYLQDSRKKSSGNSISPTSLETRTRQDRKARHSSRPSSQPSWDPGFPCLVNPGTHPPGCYPENTVSRRDVSRHQSSFSAPYHLASITDEQRESPVPSTHGCPIGQDLAGIHRLPCFTTITTTPASTPRIYSRQTHTHTCTHHPFGILRPDIFPLTRINNHPGTPYLVARPSASRGQHSVC
ncbi:hypothetical protein B0T19DRAFT_208288 [Cercophora scortea]|uniref:Uncharacterized protein n=1 Tax=Cercophora scortea TaxID=314031 RepID=A0AAE0IEH3_9PEZI|nr:hypothetical protein B0T19DRAFT_208288 [Cercophora scortea]